MLSPTATIDTKFYKHLGLGYAATVQKAQGTTVDRTYVLATRTSTGTPLTSRSPVIATTPPCSTPATTSAAAVPAPPPPKSRLDSRKPYPAQDRRNSPKTTWSSRPDPNADMVSGLVLAEWEKKRNQELAMRATGAAAPTDDLDARQQAAAERWAARQHKTPMPGESAQPSNIHTPERELRRTPELRRDGPEDDLEI